MRSDWLVYRRVLGLLVCFLVPQVHGQVVQLPTFHTFSIGTTVLIPDRGSMSLGGINRSSVGRSEFGVPGIGGVPGVGRLFANRAIGGQVQASRVNAGATIMDLQELDRQVLGQTAGAAAPAANPAVARKAAFLAQHVARNNQAMTAQSTAAQSSPGAVAGKNTNQQPAVTLPATLPDAESQAREAYELARQAESRGQFASARINYKRAATLSRGQLRTEALARLSAISTPTQGAKSPIR